MKEVLDRWIQEVSTQTPTGKILYQIWLYGLFCEMADNREQGNPSLADSTIADFLEYGPEVQGDLQILDPLQTLTQTVCQTLPKQEEVDRYAQGILEEAKKVLSQDQNYLSALFAGEEIQIKEDVVIKKEEPKPVRRPHTRRVKGRRAITPIKRRGQRVFTRHARKHDKAHVSVPQPASADLNPQREGNDTV